MSDFFLTITSVEVSHSGSSVGVVRHLANIN